jgi:hypothetical protein
MKTLLIGLSVFATFMANATHIVTNAEITSVENTSAGTNEFVLHLVGGGGVCTNGVVRYYRANADLAAGNSENGKEVHNRAYSAALAAFMSGKRVSVATISNSESCNDAVWIKLHK